MKKQWMLLSLVLAFGTVSFAQQTQQQPGPEQGGPSVNAPTNADPGQTAPDGSINPSIKNPAQPGDSAPVGENPTATGTGSGYGDTDTPKGTQDTATHNMAPNSDTASGSMAKVSDADLQSAVRSKLSSDPAFSNVQATVEGGDVTLDGTVASKEEKKRLKEEIKAVSGVRKIKEKVKVGSETQASPAASGAGPGMAFMSQDSTQSGTSSDQNTAGSTAGNSDTSANPSSQAPSATTPQSGSMGAGQTGATPEQNSGATIPQSDSATAASSGDTLSLQRQIQSAITNEPSLAQSTVTVSVSDSAIDLEGTVANDTAKMNAERIAQSYASNRKITNNLQITGRGNSDMKPGHSSMDNTGATTPSSTGNVPDSTGSGSTSDQSTQPKTPQQ